MCDVCGVFVFVWIYGDGVDYVWFGVMVWCCGGECGIFYERVFVRDVRSVFFLVVVE